MPHTPTSLAGYQSLCNSAIEENDLVLPEFWQVFGTTSWRLAKDIPGLVHCRTSGEGKFGNLSIYRELAVPKQSDSHEKDQAYWDSYAKERSDARMGGSKLEMTPNELASTPPGGLRFVAGSPKAKTDDTGKPPLAHLPWKGLREVAMVQAYGHQKYKDYNNYRKGMEVGRNVSCAIRHLSDFMEGQDLDSESGRSHLAHAACRVLFVLQNLADGTAIDDRFKKP